MYCKQCGAKLAEDDKFCSECGASQDSGGEKSAAQVAQAGRAAVQGLLKKAEKSNLFNETVGYGKAFLSHDPTRAISMAAGSSSFFWILAIAVNLLLFAFAVCNNLAQTLGQGVGWLTHIVVTYLKETVPGGSAAFRGAEEQLAMEVSPLYSLFLPLLFVAGLVLALEFAGVYLSFRAAKQQPNSVHNLLNVIGVSTFPLTLVCLANLLLGLIYPAITICTLIIALILHIVLLYEGMKRLTAAKVSPIWILALIALLVCVIFLFAAGSMAKSALTDLLDMLASAGMDLFSKTFGSFLGGFF